MMAMPGGRRSEHYAWYVVGTLLIAWILAYLDRQILILLIPSLKADLGLTDTQVSLIQGLAFGLFFALAGIPIGWMVDRWNRRNIVAIGLAVWSLMTILCGLSDNFTELFVARMGVGIGEACLAPASFSIIADYFTGDRRGRAMGVIAMGAPFGGAASNFIGALLLRMFGGRDIVVPLLGTLAPWQCVLVLIGLPGLLGSLLMLTVREPPRTERAVEFNLAGVSFPSYMGTHWRLFVPLYAALAFLTIGGNGIAVWAPVLMMRSGEVDATQVGFMIGTVMLILGPSCALGGGALGDLLARRRPLDGRMLTFLISMPVSIVGTLAFALPLSAMATTLALAVVLVGTTILLTASYATLHALVPNELRGQTIAVLALINNIIGYGVGAFAIAATTDYVLGDESLLREAIVIICLPAFILTLLLSLFALAPHRRLRAELLDRSVL